MTCSLNPSNLSRKFDKTTQYPAFISPESNNSNVPVLVPYFYALDILNFRVSTNHD
ncbi:MAG: hypothetical protein KAT05_02775 [Spirochaetes bacterium]|nr:hypothetical protein [Spirochaetota bacterium]